MPDNDSWQRYRVPLVLVGIAVLLVAWLIWPKEQTATPTPGSVTQPTSIPPSSVSQAPATPQLPQKLAHYQGSEPQLVVYMSDQGYAQNMAFEDYIAGVVAAEMDPSWPEEALAAQAILSRSYTLQKIGETGGAPAHNADASTDINEFQAYDSSKITDAVRQAVVATRGVVLLYQNDFVHGWFHSDSGGVTATAQEGLGYDKMPTPYITVTDDSAMRNPPENIASWTMRFPKWQVINAISNTGVQVASLNGFAISERGPSGRVTKFTAEGQMVDALKLRSALGSTALKSLLLTAEPYLEGDQVVFQGKGYGHGVGMSQYGAKGMAEAGKTATEILQFYFDQTDVARLYA